MAGADRPQSIDSIKSLISRRGGIARGNRFGVHIAHPLKGARLFKFKDKPIDFIQDGRDTYMLCTSVTLPGKRIATTPAEHNHHLAKKPYSMATDEVNMTFLLTNDYYIKKYFDLWQELIIDSSGNHYKTRYKNEYCAQVTIQALVGNSSSKIGYSNILKNAYPIQVSQVELGNASDSLMEITVTWEYDNWIMDDFNEGFQDKIDEFINPDSFINSIYI
jgi:hypothetical protein